MKTSEVLFGAIDLLRDRGWIKGSFQSGKGFCLVGAINQACSFDRLPDFRAYDRAFYALHTVIFPCFSITSFNDEVCESVDDACAALEIAGCCAAAEGD